MLLPVLVFHCSGTTTCHFRLSEALGDEVTCDLVAGFAREQVWPEFLASMTHLFFWSQQMECVYFIESRVLLRKTSRSLVLW